MTDSVRFYAMDLDVFSTNGSGCEVCGKPLGLHLWADLDVNGFVTDCSYASD